MQADALTSKPISRALISAHKRGITVEAVLDKNIDLAGIPAYIDIEHGTTQGKVIIIDRSILILWDYNLTKTEEHDAENLLILKGIKPLVDRYIKNFAKHREHSNNCKENRMKILFITIVILISLVPTIPSAEFWASKQSHRYHYPTCKLARLISRSNVILFNSPQAALHEGYSPCTICNPPRK